MPGDATRASYTLPPLTICYKFFAECELIGETGNGDTSGYQGGRICEAGFRVLRGAVVRIGRQWPRCHHSLDQTSGFRSGLPLKGTARLQPHQRIRGARRAGDASQSALRKRCILRAAGRTSQGPQISDKVVSVASSQFIPLCSPLKTVQKLQRMLRVLLKGPPRVQIG
jgi:hypothetical protein